MRSSLAVLHVIPLFRITTRYPSMVQVLITYQSHHFCITGTKYLTETALRRKVDFSCYRLHGRQLEDLSLCNRNLQHGFPYLGMPIAIPNRELRLEAELGYNPQGLTSPVTYLYNRAPHHTYSRASSNSSTSWLTMCHDMTPRRPHQTQTAIPFSPHSLTTIS